MKTIKSINRKLITWIFLSIVFLYGCDESEMNRVDERSKLFKTAVEANGYLISIIEFDSCQYLISGVGNSQMMSHKGNCKFCVERSKTKQ